MVSSISTSNAMENNFFDFIIFWFSNSRNKFRFCVLSSYKNFLCCDARLLSPTVQSGVCHVTQAQVHQLLSVLHNGNIEGQLLPVNINLQASVNVKVLLSS